MQDYCFYVGALCGVIAIGWHAIAPRCRGWKHINDAMRDRVRQSSGAIAEHARGHQALISSTTGW